MRLITRTHKRTLNFRAHPRTTPSFNRAPQVSNTTRREARGRPISAHTPRYPRGVLCVLPRSSASWAVPFVCDEPIAGRTTRRFTISLCLHLALVGCSRTVSRNDAVAPATKPTGQIVQLTIDYDDGAEKRVAIAWQEGMTVLDAMAKAKAHPRGFAYDQQGEGKNAMIVQIDDLVNQKGRQDARNWLYYVNGELAQRGCGDWVLKPGDVVLWKFGTYNSPDTNPKP
jgi:hypothetical protein